jgi:hypothetical protein
MYIAYSSDSEILICNKKTEKLMLKAWFGPEVGRDLDQFDRWEVSQPIMHIEIKRNVRISGG